MGLLPCYPMLCHEDWWPTFQLRVHMGLLFFFWQFFIGLCLGRFCGDKEGQFPSCPDPDSKEKLGLQTHSFAVLHGLALCFLGQRGPALPRRQPKASKIRRETGKESRSTGESKTSDVGSGKPRSYIQTFTASQTSQSNSRSYVSNSISYVYQHGLTMTYAFVF